MNKRIVLSLAALVCLGIAAVDPAFAILPRPIPCEDATLFLVNVPPHFLFMVANQPGPTGWAIDTAPLHRSGGNPWMGIGTWDALSPAVDCALRDLGGVSIWLGLRNSDDQGARFDVKVELLLDNADVIGTATAYCVAGVTRNPLKALEVKLALDPGLEPVTLLPALHLLSLKITARMGTLPKGGTCPGHSSATGLRFYFGDSARPAGVDLALEEAVPPK